MTPPPTSDNVYVMAHKQPGAGGRRRKGGLGPHRDRAHQPEGLAARIIEKRLRLGITQEELAKRLGVSRRAVAGWELGVTPRGLYQQAVEAWLQRRR